MPAAELVEHDLSHGWECPLGVSGEVYPTMDHRVDQGYGGRLGEFQDRRGGQLDERADAEAGGEEAATVTSWDGWDTTQGRWIVHPGTYQVAVGASSNDIRLLGEANLTAPDPAVQRAGGTAAFHRPDTTDGRGGGAAWKVRSVQESLEAR